MGEEDEEVVEDEKEKGEEGEEEEEEEDEKEEDEKEGGEEEEEDEDEGEGEERNSIQCTHNTDTNSESRGGSVRMWLEDIWWCTNSHQPCQPSTIYTIHTQTQSLLTYIVQLNYLIPS